MRSAHGRRKDVKPLNGAESPAENTLIQITKVVVNGFSSRLDWHLQCLSVCLYVRCLFPILYFYLTGLLDYFQINIRI